MSTKAVFLGVCERETVNVFLETLLYKFYKTVDIQFTVLYSFTSPNFELDKIINELYEWLQWNFWDIRFCENHAFTECMASTI